VTHIEHCPMPVKGGGDCWAEPHPASSFGLCVEHWRGVVQDWVSDVPQTTRRCSACGVLNQYDTADWASANCTACGQCMDAPWLVEEHGRRVSALERAEGVPEGVVYYVRFGDRIKIGFSASFAERMRAIPHDEVLAVEPGSYRHEKRVHARFAAHRAGGQREWFAAAPEIVEHATSLRGVYGEPFQYAAAIEAQHVAAADAREHGDIERAMEVATA